MGYAVYHMEKGSGGSGGIGRHIDRIESKYGYHTFGHADASATVHNEHFTFNEHCGKPLPAAIADRITEGYKCKKAIRKDAVRFQTHILTGSHEEMQAIFSEPAQKRAWTEANKEWLSKTYGKNNIVRFTLHMDEKTPHIHAVTVPITSDGRLSAKDFANGKQALRDLQTDYALHMETFGLKRGLERTGIKHETAREYYARERRVSAYMENSQIKPIEPRVGTLKTNIEEIAEQNRRLSFLLASFTDKLERREKDLRYALASTGKAIERNKELTFRKDEIVQEEIKSVLESKNQIIATLEGKNRSQAAILDSPEKLAERYNALKNGRNQNNNRGFHI